MFPALIARTVGGILALSLLGLSASTETRADIQIAGGTTTQREAVQKIYTQEIAPVASSDVSIRINLVSKKEMLDVIRSLQDGQGQNDQSADPADNDQNAQRGLNHSGNPASDGSDDDIDGVYIDSDAQTITLCKDSAPDDLAMTFAHEYGHFVWVHELDQSQRDQYLQVYNGEDKSKLITDYAADSPEEGFAEAFSFYMLKRDKLMTKDPAEYRFLEQTLPQPRSASE